MPSSWCPMMGHFCFVGGFAQVSRTEELLEARPVLPSNGKAKMTEPGVSSAGRSSVTGVCLSQRKDHQPSLSSPSCLSLQQVIRRHISSCKVKKPITLLEPMGLRSEHCNSQYFPGTSPHAPCLTGCPCSGSSCLLSLCSLVQANISCHPSSNPGLSCN